MKIILIILCVITSVSPWVMLNVIKNYHSSNWDLVGGPLLAIGLFALLILNFIVSICMYCSDKFSLDLKNIGFFAMNSSLFFTLFICVKILC
jgi:hypothetical protein